MGLMGLFKRGSREPGQAGQFGQYFLEELINSGGMADIWLATDENKQVMAVRRLHHDLRHDSTAKKRFVRGCEVLSKIHNHEDVIGYFAHGKINGDLYLAMEYLESSNLKQLLARADRVLSDNMANILIDMAVGLEHVHDSGFMHLDFKPENILVSRNASVRLVDFDLSMPIPDKPRKLSENPGTPAYMAPEQLARHPTDHRVDIFAFGATAYELLTLRKPYPGETAKEVRNKQFGEDGFELLPPRGYNPDIPFALEKTILKCLERSPEKRYPNTTVMVRDLKSALYV